MVVSVFCVNIWDRLWESLGSPTYAYAKAPQNHVHFTFTNHPSGPYELGLMTEISLVARAEPWNFVVGLSSPPLANSLFLSVMGQVKDPLDRANISVVQIKTDAIA